MLQVTGHAGGVPKATLERGRSVSFPFSGNYGYIRNLRRFCPICFPGVVGETGGVKSVSVMEGDSVTLQNDATELQEDDLIVWRFGDKGILLATIDVETNEASINVDDERFNERLQLNQTGSLTIKNARTEHAGLYEVQLRGRESSQQFLVSVSGEFQMKGF